MSGLRKIIQFVHLISLDVAILACVWCAMIADAEQVRVYEWQMYALIALGSWSVVLLDRLLDLRSKHNPSAEWSITQRAFYTAHRGKIVLLLVANALACLWLGLFVLGQGIFEYLFLCLPFMGLFGLFALRQMRLQQQVAYMKNMFASLCFSSVCCAPSWFYSARERQYGLLFGTDCLLLAALLTVWMSAVDLWELQKLSPRSQAEQSQSNNEMSLGLPIAVLAVTALFLARDSSYNEERSWYYNAIGISAVVLYMLTRFGKRLSFPQLLDLSMLALILVPFFFSR